VPPLTRHGLRGVSSPHHFKRLLFFFFSPVGSPSPVPHSFICCHFHLQVRPTHHDSAPSLLFSHHSPLHRCRFTLACASVRLHPLLSPFPDAFFNDPRLGRLSLTESSPLPLSALLFENEAFYLFGRKEENKVQGRRVSSDCACHILYKQTAVGPPRAVALWSS